MPERRSWQKSWDIVKSLGVRRPSKKVRPLGGDLERPYEEQADFRGLRLADRNFDDIDLEDLTLPRTLVQRCRFLGVSFRNTDLMLSCLAGNGWIDCDFSQAVLIGANLCRAHLFACRFSDAVLIGCDLRDATLDACDFTGAVLTGAKINRTLKKSLKLSKAQREWMVDWWLPDDDGPDESPDKE